MDDIELHERGYPLRVYQLVRIIDVLQSLLLRLYSLAESFRAAESKSSSSSSSSSSSNNNNNNNNNNSGSSKHSGPSSSRSSPGSSSSSRRMFSASSFGGFLLRSVTEVSQSTFHFVFQFCLVALNTVII